jgi:hypothetical protein
MRRSGLMNGSAASSANAAYAAPSNREATMKTDQASADFFARMSRQEIALHFANRMGMASGVMPGFRVTHPDDIAKGMLMALPYMIAARAS